MKDHALLFSALLAVFVAAAFAAALLANDPVRGLLLGMVPMLLALVVWALTNRAGYPNRVPDTLAHERTPLASSANEAGDEAPTWDPFQNERHPTQPGSEGAQPPAVSGDPFSPAKSAPAGEKPTSPSVPDRPGTKKAPQSKESQRGKAPAAGIEGTSSAPRESMPAQKPPPKTGPSQPTSGGPDAPSKVPPAQPTPDTETVRRKQVKPEDEKTTQGQTVDETSQKPNPSRQSPAKPAEPPTETPAEYLSPAEAARQAAEARKRSSRKGKGKPDEAA